MSTDEVELDELVVGVFAMIVIALLTLDTELLAPPPITITPPPPRAVLGVLDELEDNELELLETNELLNELELTKLLELKNDFETLDELIELLGIALELLIITGVDMLLELNDGTELNDELEIGDVKEGELIELLTLEEELLSQSRSCM